MWICCCFSLCIGYQAITFTSSTSNPEKQAISDLKRCYLRSKIFFCRQLEEKLELSVFASKQATDELSSDRLAWKESEIAFEKKIEKISEKYNEAKQEIAENEKVGV